MTPGTAVFWTYLTAYGSIGGVAALVLGLIARFTVQPFDTPPRLRVFIGLSVIVALMSIVASALIYKLTYEAGAFASFRVSSTIGPFLTSVVIFIWASGFPPSRLLPRRR